MRHPIPSRLAAGAAAAGLALVLSACSGGSSESEQPAEQNGSAAEQTSAPADDALKQLNEDELATVLNELTYDGKSFATIDVEPPAVQSAIEQFEQADVEPAACQDVLIELVTKPSADAPNKSALSDDNGYTAAIASYETNNDAAAALQNMIDTSSTCKNMTMTVAGERIEMEMSVDVVDIPGADQAIETVTTSPMAPGTQQHTVSAVVKNGLVTGSAQHDSTTEKSVGITTELVSAYDEATS
ncbi:hypothetical protein [Brevibacterium luteolum]|uniref:hypothetical protein n=1 Tax=Brevibacterium luteolum TaxID=199591 RepID=UPI003B672AED